MAIVSPSLPSKQAQDVKVARVMCHAIDDTTAAQLPVTAGLMCQSAMAAYLADRHSMNSAHPPAIEVLRALRVVRPPEYIASCTSLRCTINFRISRRNVKTLCTERENSDLAL